MGFTQKHIKSDEHHYQQYECNICQSLVDLDCLVTTTCSHVFFRSCLLPWLERQDDPNDPSLSFMMRTETIPKCPTCNGNLLFSNVNNLPNNNRLVQASASMMVGGRALLVQPLELCQPLAHRVLKRVQVSCPLQDASSCSWQGDYGDLQTHLLSPTAHCDHEESTTTTTTTLPRSSSSPSEAMDVDTSITAPPNEEMQLKRSLAIASCLKEEANARFATKHYAEARDLYSKAVVLLDTDKTDKSENVGKDKSDTNEQQQEERATLLAALYSNRAACQHGLNEWALAVEDASTALSIDCTYGKAYVRKARALVQMAEFTKALSTIQEGLTQKNCPIAVLQKEELRVTKLVAHRAKSKELLAQNEFAAAKTELSHVLRETTSPVILLEAAQADLGMGLVDSARRLCMQAVRSHPQDESLAYLVQGQCNLLSAAERDDESSRLLESGTALLKRAIRLDPDSSTAKTTKQWLKAIRLLKDARQAAFERKFETAADLYSTCMASCPLLPPKAPLHCALHTERAQVLLRVKHYDAVLKDVALVLYHRQDHVPAWLIRFSALHGKGQHETVLEEARDLLQTWGENDRRIQQAYEKAEFETRKAKRPDYYKILGVSSIASEREIKKAYRQVAKDLHPDRLTGASESQKSDAQKQFHQLSQGLEILSDDFQRKLYDEGYDPEAIKERVEAAEQAARRSKYYGGFGRHGGHF